jgi:hypothetical protein
MMQSIAAATPNMMEPPLKVRRRWLRRCSVIWALAGRKIRPIPRLHDLPARQETCTQMPKTRTRPARLSSVRHLLAGTVSELRSCIGLTPSWLCSGTEKARSAPGSRNSV